MSKKKSEIEQLQERLKNCFTDQYPKWYASICEDIDKLAAMAKKYKAVEAGVINER